MPSSLSLSCIPDDARQPQLRFMVLPSSPESWSLLPKSTSHGVCLSLVLNWRPVRALRRRLSSINFTTTAIPIILIGLHNAETCL